MTTQTKGRPPWLLSEDGSVRSAGLEAVLAGAERDDQRGSGQAAPQSRGRDDGASSLAAAFCEEVKGKMKRLQEEVERRDRSIAALHVEMQNLQQQHRYVPICPSSADLLLCTNRCTPPAAVSCEDIIYIIKGKMK